MPTSRVTFAVVSRIWKYRRDMKYRRVQRLRRKKGDWCLKKKQERMSPSKVRIQQLSGDAMWAKSWCLAFQESHEELDPKKRQAIDLESVVRFRIRASIPSIWCRIIWLSVLTSDTSSTSNKKQEIPVRSKVIQHTNFNASKARLVRIQRFNKQSARYSM